MPTTRRKSPVSFLFIPPSIMQAADKSLIEIDREFEEEREKGEAELKKKLRDIDNGKY